MKKFGKIIISALLAGILVYLLWWRWRVSTIRFFDADEFSYLHWAAQIIRGERQYVDFFSFVPPGFVWVLIPIHWLYGVSTQVFTGARVFSFVIFLGILSSLGYLWAITKGWKWALLPVVILAFLPMPYDKFLEIRPDNLAILLALAGVITEIYSLRTEKPILWFTTGLLYSASLFVLTKTFPIVGVGALVAILSGFSVKMLTSRRFFTEDFLKKSGLMIIGICIPWALYLLGDLITGHLAIVWYSLTRLPFDVFKSFSNEPMVANLFFYPNASFYGGREVTAGLIVNHALWLIGIFVGAYRLFNPFESTDRKSAWTTLLLGLIFFVSIFAYVKFFPFKHSQYLIPIAIFVAYYAADGLSSFFGWIWRFGGMASLSIVLIAFAYLLVTITYKVNAPKLIMSNAGQLKELRSFIQTVPRSARVVDLEGRMVFWRSGYPICCLPFDTFLPYVTRGPEPLAIYLENHPADYIYQGDKGLFASLSQTNLAYIQAYYAPVPAYGGTLWKRK